MSTMVKTIREIGGEVWAELLIKQRTPDNPLSGIDPMVLDTIIDVITGTLARHAGCRLDNDADMPVTPLPREER